MSTTTKETPVSLLGIANLSGPFIEAGLVTAMPTKTFLEGLRDPNFTSLQIPDVLYLGFYSDTEEVEVDAWRFYLSMAMARQFSYCKRLAMRPKYKFAKIDNTGFTLYGLYHAFYFAFSEASKAYMKSGMIDIEKENALIEQERLLTYETFHHFPELFVKSIEANATLLEELLNLSSEEHIKRANDPYGLLETMQERLKSEWIRLDDAEDALSGDSELYGTWLDLQEDKRILKEDLRILREKLAKSREIWMDTYAIAADGFGIWVDPCDRRSALGSSSE